VVLIPSSVDLVGVSTHVYNLARLLRNRGLLDAVVCPQEGWLSQALKEEGIPYFVVDISFRPLRYISSNLSLFRFLASRRSANIVHFHGRFPLFVSVASLLACRHLRFVATVHQFTYADSDGRYGWKQRVETLMLRRMERICCVSESLRKEVLSRIGSGRASRTDLILNWIEPLWHKKEIDQEKFHTLNDSSRPRMCAVGRLAPEKGFDILIRAVALLREMGLEIYCDIIGEGPEKNKLFNLVEETGTKKNIHFEKPSAAMRHALPGYDAVVVPSRSESFGIVALEAYDASVPVIASDIGGLRTTVVDGYTGLLFEPGNPRSLADKIRLLTETQGVAKQLALNGAEYLERFLPSEELAQQYEKFYRGAALGA